MLNMNSILLMEISFRDSLNPVASAQLQSFILNKVGFLVLGSIFLALGLMIVLLTLFRFKNRYRAVLLFGVMSLLWGLRFICRVPTIQLLVGGDIVSWELFTRFLTYLSAPPAFGFVLGLFGSGWRSSIRISTWASIIFALIASLFLVLVPNPDLLIYVFNIMILVAIVPIIANLLRPEHRNRSELKALVVGMPASLVFIILENLRSLGVVSISFDVEWIGVVILYVTMGFMAVTHFIGVERKLAILNQELQTARRIQDSILPHNPPVTRGLSIATRYVPMTEVAGDFFDFAKIDDTRQGFLIADVSGHGVPAAIVAAMVKVAFQTQLSHSQKPDLVLSGMNEILGHRLEGQFVTAGYACIDTSQNTLCYAGAGHPALLLLSKDGKIRDVPSAGLMLGPFPDAQYTSVDLPLNPGDRILMYTDGITETFNTNEQEFGDQRLKELLSDNMDLSVEEMTDRLLAEVRMWASVDNDESLEDDLTMIMIDVLV